MGGFRSLLSCPTYGTRESGMGVQIVWGSPGVSGPRVQIRRCGERGGHYRAEFLHSQKSFSISSGAWHVRNSLFFKVYGRTSVTFPEHLSTHVKSIARHKRQPLHYPKLAFSLASSRMAVYSGFLGQFDVVSELECHAGARGII